MDLLGQSSLVLSLTSFALGFSVLARNPKNKVFLAYAALASVVSFWALSFALDKLFETDAAYLFHLFFHVWLAPAGLFFVRLMVRVNDTFSQRLLGLSVFGALSLSLALGFDLSENNWVVQGIFFSPALVFVQTLYMMWVDRSIRKGASRSPKQPAVGLQRKSWVYLGALLVLAASVTGHVPGVPTLLPTLGNVALAIYLFLISQAITQQRLLNFAALVSRLIVLLIIALTLTGIYFLLVAWIEDSPGLFFLNSFIASFLILMLLDPLRSAVGYLNQRLLSQTHRKLMASLREAQRKLTGVTEPGVLYQNVLSNLESWLAPQAMAFYVLRSDGTRFQRVRSAIYGSVGVSSGEEFRQHSGVAAREVLANHSLLEGCLRLQRRGDLPILLDQVLENEIDRSTSRLQRESLLALVQGLKALGGNLLIPLLDGGKILGFIVLDVPHPPEPWGNNWGILQVIYPFFEQVAETLRNMEVFVRQREKERLAELGEMAAGLAHEIRNPLGAIKGAAQFLDPSADRPESRFLGIILEEVDRLNRVVTQFLDFSKPWGGEMRSLDLVGLVEKTLERIRLGTPAHVELIQGGLLGSGQELRILGAGEQLQQVLINLVQNAVRAIESRSGNQRRGKIQVSLESSHSGRNSHATLIVEDDGPGIKRQDLEKIFIPFFTTHPQGTGLGLPICQKIIEAHRGRIEVVSEGHRFTRFTVTLPIDAVEGKTKP